MLEGIRFFSIHTYVHADIQQRNVSSMLFFRLWEFIFFLFLCEEIRVILLQNLVLVLCVLALLHQSIGNDCAALTRISLLILRQSARCW